MCTFFIYGHRYQLTAIEFENVLREAITGFLNPDTSSRVEQDSSGDLERLLGTVDDQDLFWFAAYGSGDFQVVGNRAAETLTARRSAIVSGVGIHGPTATRDQAGPDLMRELIERDLPDAECSQVNDPREILFQRKNRGSRRDRPPRPTARG